MVFWFRGLGFGVGKALEIWVYATIYLMTVCAFSYRCRYVSLNVCECCTHRCKVMFVFSLSLAYFDFFLHVCIYVQMPVQYDEKYVCIKIKIHIRRFSLLALLAHLLACSCAFYTATRNPKSLSRNPETAMPNRLPSILSSILRSGLKSEEALPKVPEERLRSVAEFRIESSAHFAMMEED